MTTADPTITAAIIVVVVVTTIADTVRKYRSRNQSDAERARDLYFEGEIDHQEFERRTGRAVDPERDLIRHIATDAPGVDEQIADGLADQFETSAAFRDASVEELQEINGVGPSRAQAIDNVRADH